MKAHGTSLSFPNFQLFPDGPAIVIGIPQSFDISSEIASANAIRLVTAFAHKSGWEKLSAAISDSKATTLRLLTGTSFFQTEPRVLSDWLALSASSQLEAKLYHPEKGITFHPKVLIVEASTPFAIVGSGNLSLGGLHHNVECAVFVESSALLAQLRTWFDGVFFSERARTLTDMLLANYSRMWSRRRDITRALEKQQEQLEDEYLAKTAASMKRWDDAVSAAKNFLNSQEFQDIYAQRSEGGNRIKQYLRYPVFDFDAQGWNDFYTVKELGHLIPIYRDRIFRKKVRLQEGLRNLVAGDGNTNRILDELLSERGKYRIDGLGLNVISKVLAVHDPLKWAVYNGPVEKSLNEFGYVRSRGGSAAAKFGAFTQMMQTFKSATGLPDAYGLDAFFYDVYERSKKKSH